jgi:23S rRNA (adenine-N6)-dimethyltransferase
MARRDRSTLWRTQNFLRDPKLVEAIVGRADIGKTDTVYDLGAGRGAITNALSRRAGRVIAIEKDPRLSELLRARFADSGKVDVRQADILTHALPRRDYIVFANPPFDVTAAIVRRLTTAPVPPRDAYLVLQHEAAQRYLGRPRQTLAALLIAPWFSVRIVYRFARADFVPPPMVDAVLVRLHKRGPPLVAANDAQAYRDFVVACFVSWRPSVGEALRQLIGSGRASRALTRAEIDPAARPSALSFPDWLELFRRAVELDHRVRTAFSGAEQRLRRRQRRIQRVHRTRAPRDALGPPGLDQARRRMSRARSASSVTTARTLVARSP